MKPNANKELLLVTLSGRCSAEQSSRLNLGRLMVLFAGIAAVLLLANSRPASAGGFGSVLPQVAGFSVSIPLGGAGVAEDRPGLQLFTVVDGEPVRFDLTPRPQTYQMAFLDLAAAAGLAGVNAQSKTYRTARPIRKLRQRRVPTDDVSRSTAEAAGRRVQVPARATHDRRHSRRIALAATRTYQQMLRRYLSAEFRSTTQKAAEHARLVKAYRSTAEWRRQAGLD